MSILMGVCIKQFKFREDVTGFRTGHGKPGKSWNLRISFSRPGRSWNLVIGPGQSWKINVLFGRLVTVDDKARIV